MRSTVGFARITEVRTTRFVAAYLVVGLVVALVEPAGGQAAWYPPIAIGVAALFVLGPQVWWVLLLCELVVAIAKYDLHPLPGLVSAVVTTGEELLVWALLVRLGFRRTFESVEDVLWMGVAGALGAVAAASLGTPLLSLTGFHGSGEWNVWAIGDLTGLTICLPIALLLVAERDGLSRYHQIHGRRLAEFLTASALSVGAITAYFVVIDPASVSVSSAGPLLLAMLPLFWVAVRFDTTRITLLIIAVDVAASLGFTGLGPHVFESTAKAPHDMAVVQVPMFAIALAALGVTAAIQGQLTARRSERALLDAAPLAIMAVDLRGRVSTWNAAAEQMFGHTAADVMGKPPPMIPAAERIPVREILARPLTGRQVEYVHRDGHAVVGKLFTAAIADDTGTTEAVLSVIEDVTAMAWMERRQALLSTAFEAAAESIVVTDLDAMILYTNPAASTTSGWTREELLGRPAGVFKSGLHDRAFYEQMWSTITAGASWRGVVVNRRKNGELYDEQLSITPVRDETGTTVAYVSVKHDLTTQRRLEADIEHDKRSRGRVLAVMEEVHAHENMYDTATALCRAVVRHSDFEVAIVLVIHADGSLEPIGEAVPLMGTRTGGLLSSRTGANEVVALTTRSAWWIPTDSMPVGAAHWRDRFTADGIVVTAYAPMRWESELFGVLLVASRDPSSPTWVESTMAMLTEIGSFGGVLIGAQIEELRSLREQRDEIREIIEHERFRPVFQRYVDLATSEIRGFEALTRFDDGVRPDRKIHSAWLAGMGEELEAACATVALAAADDVLEPGQSLSVNFSPLSVLHGTAARVVRDASRPVVIEVTEHTAIDDYDQLRRALHECGPIKVSVDDAGAGFSSLRHILELRPDVVKLDIGLIKGIDADLARQALVAGLSHYASGTGTLLIAEGVETEEEAATVRRLGVHYGQGYWFGRPTPQG